MNAGTIAEAPNGDELDQLLAALANGAGSHARPRSAGEIASDFLRQLDPIGRHNLVAFRDDRLTDGRTFEPGAWREITEWVNQRDGKANIYFSLNEPAPNAPHGKLQKSHIARIRALHCDVDPSDGAPFDLERSRLHDLAQSLRDRPNAPPSLTIDSGGGVQLLWRLPEPLDAETYGGAAEGLNRGLIRDLGGDPSTWNLDRLLRLPGTMNLPNAKKRARGQVERRAALIAADGLPVTMQGLAAVHEPASTAAKADSDADERIQATIDELDMAEVTAASVYGELPDELRKRVAGAYSKSDRLDRTWAGDTEAMGEDKTGSGRRFALAKALALARAGNFSAQEFGSLLWVWDHAVSDGQTLEEKITPREIARCWVKGYWQNSSERLAQEFYEPVANDAALSLSPAAKRFHFETADDLAAAALQSGPKPLVKNFLDQGAMSVLYGESNCGKTFIVLDLACHIACGREWSGLKVAQGAVVYVATEGGRGVAKRVAALRSRLGPIPHLFVLRQSVDLLRLDGDLRPLIEALRDLGQPISLVVIDTLSRAMAGGDENASTDMGTMVLHFDKIRAATSAHLMVVHHSGKDKAKGARGHSNLRAATDTEIEITEGALKVTKQRDLDRNVRFNFALEPVTLGVDEDDEPVISCVVRLRPYDELSGSAGGRSEAEQLRRSAIASAAHRALDGAGSARVSVVLPRLAEELIAAGLCDGDTLPTIRGVLAEALDGSGVEIQAGGQTVRMRASKDGPGRTAPWILVAMKVPMSAETDCPETLESLESARKPELFS
ncbi:AAA family ATPase [Methylopila sp. M107]|uniref:AAA family ATPase n=1 Tax=Methylopila sp. M107 TaxID=1101190 RepID=UPI0003998A62|nr:AAA family ATPase [Methylopila sp. M107]